MINLMVRLASAILALAAIGLEPARAENLLRNGSFEGGLLYWHNVRPKNHRLVRGHAKVGRHALRIEEGYVASAPFVTKRGKKYTVSLFVKADKPGKIRVSMPPSAREVGTKAKRLWTRGASQEADVDTEWQRVSFTWSADVPPAGFWPLPHYIVHIGSGNTTPILVDGVTVTSGTKGTTEYLPRREIEVVADCPDLPGYEGAKANLFDRDATVRMTAHASNPTTQPHDVTLRWQLFDYEGERAVGEPVERRVTIPAGDTLSQTVPLKLVATGTVIARVSAVSAATVLDSSDFPLTSLPYPKSATEPDWRERFGGSFAGGIGCVEKFQRLGFGWIRWRPHANGRDHVPLEPKPGVPWQWKWFDRELDEQEALGCSAHICLYPPPTWIMEKGHPLPKDMRWRADDPRWDDLDLETTWDKFVKTSVAHYKGRSVIFEIENEPEFSKWDTNKILDEYARFTIRTARLIRQTDLDAKIMVNNVYGIPSRVNAALFKAGGLKYVDVISWHDYHAGWLADATAIRRMRQNLDEAGGQHVEIWFNEGWAYTNTLVDEPIACTGLTSAQSCNAIVDSVAELTVNGQEKTILFHTAYETHGMSFWDYSGPGTMLWDWYNYPLPLAAVWNVLNHHIGISEEVGFVRPPGANFCIFDNVRGRAPGDGRGVMIAYADRDAKTDVTVALPDFGATLVAEDVMGNAKPASSSLTLSKTGRPVLLYTSEKTPGRVFLDKLSPLDRKHASFVSQGQGSDPSWSLPAAWEGTKKDSTEGNPISADGRPIWRIDRVYPDKPIFAENYSPIPWDGTAWHPQDHQQGGQPKARIENGSARLSVAGPWQNYEFQKIVGLVFIPPESGTYRVRATAHSKPWTGAAKTFKLAILKKDTQRAAEVAAQELPRDGSPVKIDCSVELSAGHELVFLPLMPQWNNATTTTIKDLQIQLEQQMPR